MTAKKKVTKKRVAKKKAPAKSSISMNDAILKCATKLAKLEQFLLTDPIIAPRYRAYIAGEQPAVQQQAQPQEQQTGEMSQAEIDALLASEQGGGQSRIVVPGADGERIPHDDFANQGDTESAFL